MPEDVRSAATRVIEEMQRTARLNPGSMLGAVIGVWADDLLTVVADLSQQIAQQETELATLRHQRDRNVALSLELGQILGPNADGQDLREVARELVAARATLAQQAREQKESG